MLFPTLIQFEHRGEMLLSVRGENTSYISVTPEEQGKVLAHALGRPLFWRQNPASPDATPLQAAVDVQNEWATEFALSQWEQGAVGCPIGFNIIA
jgi:hypothetical protein